MIEPAVSPLAPLLTLQQLGCERDQRALFGQLSTDWYSGDIIQILGPNGCGKTTLLRVLAGVSSNYHGDIFWHQKHLSSVRWDYAQDITYLGHLPGIKKALTPLENLHWYTSLSGGAGRETALQALDQVGLSGYENTYCYQLSAGQLRRVALARLLLSEAAIWILDEPFTAIDKAGVSQLEMLIQQHSERGGLTVLTSHQDLALEGVKPLSLLDYQCASTADPMFGEARNAD